MKNDKLDKEESAILKAFENDELKLVKNQKAELKKLQASAKAHSKKVRRVNIRLTDWDYEKAQVQALEQGLPVTTFIAAMMHQVLSGQFTRHNTLAK
jgi:predicted DNA binding CopG/RHH family protein